MTVRRFSTSNVIGTKQNSISKGKTVEFWMWGAGGGSGSSNRANISYRTSNYYRCKEGGAGGVVYAKYSIVPGTQITLTVGGGGRGGLLQGNPSSASGGFNGGGNGTYGSYDASGGGGGYTGVYLTSIGKSQAGFICIAPGGGGGGGGPGYPANGNGQANGGGGITLNGVGNAGTRNYGYFNAVAGGGTLTAGGVGGDATASAPGGGDGVAGSALAGANAYFWNNAWGNGGGGGAGWFGGGSGCNDGDSWDGGGGGAGSALVRGSGLSYSAAGLTVLSGVSYLSHTFYTQPYGAYGDGTNTYYGPITNEMSGTSALNSMRMPMQTDNALYPGSFVGYGGPFRNGGTATFSGYDGYNGALVYRIDGGSWTTVSYSGTDTTITI